jgi:quercetin dioxygenase-like cupin family protein
VSPGGITRPHIHTGGQVMIVTAGRGFVEVEGKRFELGPGDVVTPPANSTPTVPPPTNHSPTSTLPGAVIPSPRCR